MEKNSSEVLLLCNYGGYIINFILFNKDVCDRCGYKGSFSNNIFSFSNLNYLSN